MNAAIRRMLTAAEARDGITTRTHARRAGVSDTEVDSSLRNGLLLPVAPGVYRVRGCPQTLAMATTAAVIGSGGAVSHATAARVLRLDAPLAVSPIHVTVDRERRHPRLRRVRVATVGQAFFAVSVHRPLVVAAPQITIDGLRCVDAARALIDVAPQLGDEALEAAFERARRLGLVSTEVLARRFAEVGGQGRPGTARIREVLAHAAPNPLESLLEVKAWRLLRASSLEIPVRQLPVTNGGRRYRLDFAWPELCVAFETEGFEWHGTRARWKQDRMRTAALERLGWRQLVGTWDDVVGDPSGTLARIAAALHERRRLASS